MSSWGACRPRCIPLPPLPACTLCSKRVSPPPTLCTPCECGKRNHNLVFVHCVVEKRTREQGRKLVCVHCIDEKRVRPCFCCSWLDPVTSWDWSCFPLQDCSLQAASAHTPDAACRLSLDLKPCTLGMELQSCHQSFHSVHPSHPPKCAHPFAPTHVHLPKCTHPHAPVQTYPPICTHLLRVQ